MIKYVGYGHNGTIGNRVQAGFQKTYGQTALSAMNIDAWFVLTNQRAIIEHKFENMVQ